jgi:hypothetical protein
MADNANGKTTEEELKPVGPGADDLAGEVIVNEDDERDETIQAADEDERIGRSDDEDREAIRQRRREEKHRRKEKRQRDTRELQFLRTRNEQLERRFSSLEGRQAQGEVLAIDQRISELTSNIKLAEDTYAEAISGNKGAEAAEALRIRDQLRDNLRDAQGIKERAVQGEKQRREAPRVPPEIQSHANDWMQENDWFDPSLADEDSAIAKAVEASVARSGQFNPATQEYWDEVSRRCKKRLPHLFEEGKDNGRDDDADEEEEKRPRGPRMTTGGRERPLKPGEVYVSPERRKAMEEAGVWDDPPLRARYLKQYAKYDADHGRRRH